jgi:hypothetical protein
MPNGPFSRTIVYLLEKPFFGISETESFFQKGEQNISKCLLQNGYRNLFLIQKCMMQSNLQKICRTISVVAPSVFALFSKNKQFITANIAKVIT